VQAVTFALLTGEGHAGGEGEAGIPTSKEIWTGECVSKRKVGKRWGSVIDEKGERVGHAWEICGDWRRLTGGGQKSETE
jgi:hypothetical protein